MAGPFARQAFGDENGAEGAAVASDHPELSSVLVLVAISPSHYERPFVEKLAQALGGLRPKQRLVRAAWRMGFRRIDIDDADPLSLIVERIAINDAVAAAKRPADAEGRGDGGVAAGTWEPEQRTASIRWKLVQCPSSSEYEEPEHRRHGRAGLLPGSPARILALPEFECLLQWKLTSQTGEVVLNLR